ncbi:MAG: septum formation protein Maf, partial [Leptospiraceae bacterium]|nr:septum formation protein Maf [Leptospiraceae bacterium]
MRQTLDHLSAIKPILASQSQRRKELFTNLNIAFEVHSANIDEDSLLDDDPVKTVIRIAREKAYSVSEIYEHSRFIVAADTVVSIDNVILGKPKNAEDAFRMLATISGATHEVYTGVAIQYGKWAADFYECTKVEFDEIPKADIFEYIESGEVFDRAGAYGIQDAFGLAFIRAIHGDFFNVMGFPMNAFLRFL